MRIIFVENEDLDRNSSGGVMSYLINLSKYIRENNGENVLIGSGIVNSEKRDNRFSRFYSISKDSNISNFKFFIKLFTSSELKYIYKDDIIHVQRSEMVIPLFFRKRNRIICTLHGGQDLAVLKKKGRLAAFFYSILQFLSFVLADQLIVVDERNLVRYLKKYPWIKYKTNFIPISVDTTRFYPQDRLESKKIFNLPLDEKIILYIGRLEYEKNVAFIIDSFKEVKYEKCKLLIVGTGSLSNKLKEIASLYLDKIIFMGEINNLLIPKIINSANVVVLASYFEGSPTVIKEALCCGIPIVSTDVGDVRKVVNLVNGGEIIDYTTESFLNGISKVLFRKEKVSKDASILFSLKSMGDKTVSIYKS